jgi:hypothetical protein
VRARGSPGYRAPELVREHTAYSKESDIWSLGCILYELAYGKAAFTNDIAVFNFESIQELPMPDIGSRSRFTDALRVELLTPMLELEYTNRSPARRLVERLLRCLSWISHSGPQINHLEAVADCVIGTDGPISSAFPRWDDLFLPGHIEQHSAMFERYKQVSKARNAVLGKYHSASIWSASRVVWGTFHRTMGQFPCVWNDETLFHDLADRQVNGRSISPAQQTRNVLAADIGAELSLWGRVDSDSYRLRDLIVAYRTLAAKVQTDSLHTDALRVDYLLQVKLQANSESHDRIKTVRARLWTIFGAQTENLGPSHCDTLETLARIGSLCQRVREYDEAKKCFERLQTDGARLGPAHINQARCMYRLAQCHIRLSLPLDVTLQHLDMAWEGFRVVYGEFDFRTRWLAEKRSEHRQILERKQNRGIRNTIKYLTPEDYQST